MYLFYLIPRWSSLLMCFLVVLFPSGFLNVLLVFDANEVLQMEGGPITNVCLRQRVTLCQPLAL